MNTALLCYVHVQSLQKHTQEKQAVSFVERAIALHVQVLAANVNRKNNSIVLASRLSSYLQTW